MRELQKRHPEEYNELHNVIRASLLVAEDSEDYLPKGCCMDRLDPDILILNREDGTFVAVFSASVVTIQGILEAIKEDKGKV